MWSVDLCVLICEKKKKKTKTERSGSGDPLPPETKLATEAQSSIYLPYRWSGDGSFFPGSKLTPLAQWSRITLGHHIHTHTPLSTIQTITQTQCNQCKHTLCSEEVPIQAQQWGTLFVVCGWAVQRKFCVGVIRREDPNLRDGSPFTGSAASLPALPDFVRVRADAFPQSAGEAPWWGTHGKRGGPCAHSSTQTHFLSTGTELQGTFTFRKVEG